MRPALEEPAAARVAAVAARGRAVRTPSPMGGQVHWRVWGSGPPLVLLHGGHGSWLHWIANVEALAAQRTVLVPDMPGFGSSDRPDRPFSMDDMAAALLAGIDGMLGPGAGFDLAGFSFGSLAAAHLGALAGTRLGHLVLVGCGRLTPRRSPRPKMWNWRREAAAEARLAAHRHNLQALMLHHPASIDDFALHLQVENTRRTHVRSLDIADTHRLLDCLAAVEAPLDAIWGELDVTLQSGIADQEAVLRRFDHGARCVGIPDAGHWVQFEAPEAFDTALVGLIGPERTDRS